MKNKSKKWIFGAGAQGLVALDAWRCSSRDSEFHLIDDDFRLHGKILNGVKVAGGLEFLLGNFSSVDEVIVAMGNNDMRLSLGEKLRAKGLTLGNAIDVSAVVTRTATMGGGCMVFAQAVINSNAKVGRHVIVNTGAIVEHDSVIEDGAHLCTGVAMGGRVIIQKGAFIGTGTVLAPRIIVGQSSIVGAGSVVVKDIPSRVLAYGVPARVVRKVDETFDWSRLL
jgi:acetyltransferase EpsM